MKKLLSHFNLGDAYEIEARVLPAMLVVLPVAILLAQLSLAKGNWMAMIGWGAGFEIVLAVLVSKAGHALGTRLHKRLEVKWGGLPTHRWINPSDTSHSEQQKRVWRIAVSHLSGLDIDAELTSSDPDEIKRIIADAIMTCRSRLRDVPEGSLVQKYNVMFGFARNLAGMKWLALTLCLACFLASAYGSLYHQFELSGTLIQALFLVIAIINVWTASGYVKHCAARYAEFFYAAVTDLKPNEEITETDTNGI
ncbi:hypothetical protein ACFL5Z_16475 [Planctomycetota bacterium]